MTPFTRTWPVKSTERTLPLFGLVFPVVYSSDVHRELGEKVTYVTVFLTKVWPEIITISNSVTCQLLVLRQRDVSNIYVAKQRKEACLGFVSIVL